MKTLITIFIFLYSSIAVAADQIPPDKEILYFDRAKMGAVTFMHKMHSTLDGVNCTTCHHTARGNNQQEDCHNCHQPDPQGDVPESAVAFHTRCRGCHQYTVDSGKKAGPVKRCTLCHIKPANHSPINHKQ